MQAGRVDVALVDAAVRRVLRAKFRLGLFNDPYRYCDAGREQALTLTAKHRATARALARESIVLLKNQRRTLPLSRRLHTLAVIGPLADDAESVLGPWAAVGRPEEAVTVLAGIRRAVPGNTAIHYVRGADVDSRDTSGFDEAVRVTREADAVVLVLGESSAMSGEAHSRASLDLPGVQNDLAQAVRAAAGDKPVVVVLMNGRPLSIGWLDENVPAIVEAWFLGIEMGPAVADVLFGDTNPSGKLPITFPRTVGQVPIYYNHKNTGRPPVADDPFTSKYLDVPWTPLYVFGHGLSYTTFAYRDLRLSADRIAPTGNLTVEVEVMNTGDRPGDEVVQLYLQDEVGSATRPVRELRGFTRIHLAPGENQIVTFTLTPDDLACYDLGMKWVVEPGFFRVFAGTSSAATLSARFEVAASRQETKP